MSDAEEEAARREKLAAVKKRADQLKKKNKKKAAASKKEDVKDEQDAEGDNAEVIAADIAEEAASQDPAHHSDQEGTPSEAPSTPSLAQQSKLRSTSFRAAAGPAAAGVASGSGSAIAEGDTAADIYRKHVARIEELEGENRRLAKESADLEKRWQKSEEQLADLREADGGNAAGQGGGNGEVEELKSEIASLQRQNSQLQQQIARGSGHRASVSVASPPPALQAELDAKSATIESMEIEISKLKARVERQETGASSKKEQIVALEDKVARAEAAAGQAQRELHDLKQNLERTTEKAVREGSQRTSAEIKVKTLEHDLTEAIKAKGELEMKVEGLEKKVAALTTLHKEQDSRGQALRQEKEKAEREATLLRDKVEKLESQSKTGPRRSQDGGGGGGLDDEGVEELEKEQRLKLERKIRSLEAEIHELRSGAWIERRREMEATSTGFHDVDLGGDGAPPPPTAARQKAAGGGFGDFITHGLSALAGGGGGPAGGVGGEDDSFLEDDDAEFDEEAFRRAHEEENARRLERIKEMKRSLKHWEGWRLDIVDIRRGGGQGVGEIFDV